ncbi:nitroreductase family protein [Marinoscillum luteum]|uniref:Nitroreductase family protein n=1 Tax=Marinoscillum luteum TaxID=861051 RepID=A0ABW7N4U5_9BACT
MILEAKEAKTQYDILREIKDRWSPRAFAPEPIDTKTLNTLFEAMRWASSSMNEQPWRVIYAHKGEEAHKKIVDALMPGNQIWAEQAPVLMVNLVKKTYTRNGAPNKSAHHDLGLAIGNLALQATAEGIGLHQMGGFHKTQLEELFDLPEDYEAVTVIALGYFGDPDQLPEALRNRELEERNRMPIDEFVHHGQFSR